MWRREIKELMREGGECCGLVPWGMRGEQGQREAEEVATGNR